jgi:hypothetical protein
MRHELAVQGAVFVLGMAWGFVLGEAFGLWAGRRLITLVKRLFKGE